MAAVMIFGVVMAYAAVLQASDDIPKALRGQLRFLWAGPLQMVYVALGLLAGIGARVLRILLFMPYILADLWWQPAADALRIWGSRLSRYQYLRAYLPEHAVRA